MIAAVLYLVKISSRPACPHKIEQSFANESSSIKCWPVGGTSTVACSSTQVSL